jgi:hypothetical protein
VILSKLIVVGAIVALILIFLYFFFGTELGLSDPGGRQEKADGASQWHLGQSDDDDWLSPIERSRSL